MSVTLIVIAFAQCLNGDAAVGGPSNIISTNNLVNAYANGGNADEAAVQGLMCSRSLPQLRTMTSTIHVRGQSRQTAEDHSGHQGGNADKATAQVLTCSRSLTPELRMGTSTIHVRRQRRMSTEVYSTDFVYVKPMPDRVGHVNKVMLVMAQIKTMNWIMMTSISVYWMHTLSSCELPLIVQVMKVMACIRFCRPLVLLLFDLISLMYYTETN